MFFEVHTDQALLLLLIPVAAALYSAGGHGGATAYIACFSWFNLPSSEIRVSALWMNLVVSGLGFYRFHQAKSVPYSLLRWLLPCSMIAAYLGGQLDLHEGMLDLLLGLSLCIAALAIWLRPTISAAKPLHRAWLVIAGAFIGFLSGITGIGGGIYLTPILLLTHAALPKEASGAAACFIFSNSIAGLLGRGGTALDRGLPFTPVWMLAALTGGLLGTAIGSSRLKSPAISKWHGAILALSGLRVLWNSK